MTRKHLLARYSIPVLYVLAAFLTAIGAPALVHSAIYITLGLVHAMMHKVNDVGNLTEDRKLQHDGTGHLSTERQDSSPAPLEDIRA